MPVIPTPEAGDGKFKGSLGKKVVSLSQKDWDHSSSVKVPIWYAQDPEFNLHYCKKKKLTSQACCTCDPSMRKKALKVG
jgi:hypothetical protein